MPNPHGQFQAGEELQTLREFHRPQRQVKKVLRKKIRKRVIPTPAPYEIIEDEEEYRPHVNHQPFQTFHPPQSPPQHVNRHHHQPLGGANPTFNQIEGNFDYANSIPIDTNHEIPEVGEDEIHTNLGNGNFIIHKKPPPPAEEPLEFTPSPPSPQRFENNFKNTFSNNFNNKFRSTFSDTFKSGSGQDTFSLNNIGGKSPYLTGKGQDTFETAPDYSTHMIQVQEPTVETTFESFPVRNTNSKRPTRAKQNFRETFHENESDHTPVKPFINFGSTSTFNKPESEEDRQYDFMESQDTTGKKNSRFANKYRRQAAKLSSFKPTFVPSQNDLYIEEDIEDDDDDDTYDRKTVLTSGEDNSEEKYYQVPKTLMRRPKNYGPPFIVNFQKKEPKGKQIPDKMEARVSEEINETDEQDENQEENDSHQWDDMNFIGKWNVHNVYPADKVELYKTEPAEDHEHATKFEINDMFKEMGHGGLMPKFVVPPEAEQEQAQARMSAEEEDEPNFEQADPKPTDMSMLMYDRLASELVNVESLKTNSVPQGNLMDILGTVKYGLMSEGMFFNTNRPSCPSWKETKKLKTEFNKCGYLMPVCNKNSETKKGAMSLSLFGKCLIENYPHVRNISQHQEQQQHKIPTSYHRGGEEKEEVTEDYDNQIGFESDEDCTDFVHIFFKHCRVHIPSCSLVRLNQDKALPVLGCLFVRYPDLMAPLLSDK